MPSVEKFVKRMSEVMRAASENLKLAQEKQKEQADKHRRETPNWSTGDRVFVSTENFKGYNKLKEKYIGPFKIIKKLNEVTYRIELPARYRVHNVFHSSLLKPSNESDSRAFPNRSIINTQPPIVKSIDDNEDESEIEEMMDRRKRRNRIEYLARWKGWSSEYDEWKTVNQLNNARRLMREYDTKHLSSIEKLNQVGNSNENVMIAPGRVVESMQCQGRIRKGRGRRCRARTRRSRFCQAHLNRDQNLRITNSKIPNAGLGLFCGDQPIKKNQPIVEYTGEVWNEPICGDYVLEVNKKKFINGNRSIDVAGFSNDCRSVDRKAKLCQINSKITMRKGVPSLVSTKPIKAKSEIYTSYGRNYWRYHDKQV